MATIDPYYPPIARDLIVAPMVSAHVIFVHPTLSRGGRVISARNMGVIRAFNAAGSFAHAMLGPFAHSRPEVSTTAKGARALGWERVGDKACCTGQSGRGAGVEAHCVSLRDRGEGGGTCAVLGGRGEKLAIAELRPSHLRQQLVQRTRSKKHAHSSRHMCLSATCDRKAAS